MTRRYAATSIALLIGMAIAVAPSTATASSALNCQIRWGSLSKQSSANKVGPLTGVRAGRHTCYDRLVLDVDGPAVGFSVRYVDQVRTDGAGVVVPLRGGARLQIIVTAPAYDDAGRPTVPVNRSDLVDVTHFNSFRQVAGAGSFEGQSTIGLGVRARLPFRAFTVPGPAGGQTRLVIDVAHRW